MPLHVAHQSKHSEEGGVGCGGLLPGLRFTKPFPWFTMQPPSSCSPCSEAYSSETRMHHLRAQTTNRLVRQRVVANMSL